MPHYLHPPSLCKTQLFIPHLWIGTIGAYLSAVTQASQCLGCSSMTPFMTVGRVGGLVPHSSLPTLVSEVPQRLGPCCNTHALIDWEHVFPYNFREPNLYPTTHSMVLMLLFIESMSFPTTIGRIVACPHCSWHGLLSKPLLSWPLSTLICVYAWLPYENTGPCTCAWGHWHRQDLHPTVSVSMLVWETPVHTLHMWPHTHTPTDLGSFW